MPSPKRQNTSPKLSFITTVESQEPIQHHIANDKLEQEPSVKVVVETSKLASPDEIMDYEEINNDAPLMEVKEAEEKKLKDNISQIKEKEKEKENDDNDDGQKQHSPIKLLLPISPSETANGIESVVEDYTNDTTPLTKPLHDLKITDGILIDSSSSSSTRIPIDITINDNTLLSKEIHKNGDSVDQNDVKVTTTFNKQEKQHNHIHEESSQQPINTHDDKYTRQEISLDDIFDSQYDDDNSLSGHSNNKGTNDLFNSSNTSTAQTTVQLDGNISAQYNNNKVMNDLFSNNNNNNNVNTAQVPSKFNNNINTQQNDNISSIGSPNNKKYMDDLFNHYIINDNCATPTPELKKQDIPLSLSPSPTSQPDMNELSNDNDNDNDNDNKNNTDQTLEQLDHNIPSTLQPEDDHVFKPVEKDRLDGNTSNRMDIENNNQNFEMSDLPNKNIDVVDTTLEQKEQDIPASWPESGSASASASVSLPLQSRTDNDKTQISERKEQSISPSPPLQPDTDLFKNKNKNSKNSNDETQIPERFDHNIPSASKPDNDIIGKAIEEEDKADGIFNNLKNVENDDNQYFEMDHDDNDHHYDDENEGQMEEQINEEGNGNYLDDNNNSNYDHNNITDDEEIDAEMEQHIQEYMNVEQLEEKRNQLKEYIRPEILDYFKDKQLPDSIEEIDTNGLLKHLENNIESLLKPSDRKKLSDEILSTDASITKVTFDFKNKLQNPDSKRLVETFGLKLTHQLHTQFKLYTELKQLEIILKKIRRQHSTTRSKAQSLKVECDKYTKQLESKKKAFRKLQKSRKTLNEYESFFKEIQDALLE
ncbi:unnamed protein product [Cunninghamella echinulata]